MAMSPLETRPPEESDNPGDEKFKEIIEHNYSPEEKERLSRIANANETGENDGSKELDKESLSKIEASGGASDPVISHTYRPSSPHELTRMRPSFKGVLSFARTNRGKVTIGGAAAGFITLVIVGFFAVLPFKILHIMNNLQSHFFASSENAMTNETNTLFSNYVKKYVLPGITKCGSTVNKTCTPRSVAGNGLVSQLYRGWSNARLENTLAEKHGIEFEYKKSTGHYYLKTPVSTKDIDLSGFLDNNPEGLSLDDYLKSKNVGGLQPATRAEVRQAVRDSLSTETRFKKVMYRFKVGRLLEEKYGIKRCIIACTARDNFADWKNQKKIAAKALVAQRILQFRGEMVGLVIGCLTDSGCDPTALDKTGVCTPGVNCESNGEDTSAIEKDIQSKLDALAAKEGERAVSDILKLYSDLEEKGFTQFTIEQVIAALLDEEAAQAAGQTADKALPIVGWINMAAQVVGDINSAPSKIKKLTYITNATTMVATFAMYRTYADEIKTGNVDSTIVGSFTNSLGPGTSKSMGGSAEAEQTPLYSKLLGGGKYTGSSSYKCNNGQPVPAGQGTCSELQLNNTSQLTEALQNIKSQIPFFGEIAGLASLWNSTVGKLFGIVGDLISYVIPQLGETVGAVVGKVAGPLIQAVANYIIPPIASDNMGGGRTFDLIAGGADVSANDYAHNGLGGQQLSPQQTADIINEQNGEQKRQYDAQSFIARMFDTSSPYSPTARLAMAMPNSFGSIQASLPNFLAHPLRLFSSIGSIFPQANAASDAADPFGITQYGYSDNDPAFSGDPETFWNQNCTSDGTTIDPNLPTNKNYRANTTINPDTQMPENATTDPCYLIQAAAGSAGALFNSNLLTQDDLGN